MTPLDSRNRWPRGRNTLCNQTRIDSVSKFLQILKAPEHLNIEYLWIFLGKATRAGIWLTAASSDIRHRRSSMLHLLNCALPLVRNTYIFFACTPTLSRWRTTHVMTPNQHSSKDSRSWCAEMCAPYLAHWDNDSSEISTSVYQSSGPPVDIVPLDHLRLLQRSLLQEGIHGGPVLSKTRREDCISIHNVLCYS
jgi:hypothetical protein